MYTALTTRETLDNRDRSKLYKIQEEPNGEFESSCHKDQLNWDLAEAREALERDKRSFDEEKVTQERKVVRQAFELEQIRYALERDRQNFERDRQELNMELAKYKDVVENCQKEILTYFE